MFNILLDNFNLLDHYFCDPSSLLSWRLVASKLDLKFISRNTIGRPTMKSAVIKIKSKYPGHRIFQTMS